MAPSNWTPPDTSNLGPQQLRCHLALAAHDPTNSPVADRQTDVNFILKMHEDTESARSLVTHREMQTGLAAHKSKTSVVVSW